MSTLALSHEAGIVAQAAHRISTAADDDPLIQIAGEEQFVLIGEASHGTHDFYATRAELTRRLIEEKGFRIVALEADWPDMLRVHRYFTGRGQERGAAEALGDFRRFPAWMWRNTVMVELVNWLRGWNLHPDRKNDRAGIFGMDLYSMHASMESVLGYLNKVDSEAARAILTTHLAPDSSDAKIGTHTESWSKRPQLQRLGDQLGPFTRRCPWPWPF